MGECQPLSWGLSWAVCPPWVRDAVYINIENFGFPNAHRAKPLPILAMFLLLC